MNPSSGPAPTDLEASIRAELHIPDNAQHVLILSMDAHMDWDWQVTFQDYLKGPTPDSPVTEIIGEAFSQLSQSQTAPFYYYSICEMGYLEGAVQLDPSLTRSFQASIGDKLRIVGGGVTSPDNLLPHGEATIRNYLVGKTWMQNTFGLPLRQAYVPDDFGHDSQFPVLLAAMGLMGVSFSRIPGSPNQGPAAKRVDLKPSLSDQLVQAGVDFVWEAGDGSTVIAHFMQQHYNQGHKINDDPDTNIHQYISTNEPSAPTPYMYVPCGDDFALPCSVGDLVGIATTWNNTYFKGNPDDVYVVVATLDHYLQLISTYVDPNVQHNYHPYKNLVSMPFFATPYWTGYYASRIENKILHQAATRALLGAETFGAVADLLEKPDAFGFQWLAQGRRDAIWNGWQALVPSTHHDYISGTASDAVSTTEQVPLLAGTLALGEGACASAIEQIVRQVQATPKPNTDEIPVAIFNQLGFQASGPCTLPPLPGFVPQSIRFEDGPPSAVQIAYDGQYLFLATAPSLGYQAGYLSTAQVTPPETATISSPDNNVSWFLSNGVIQANVTSLLNWGIASLVANGESLFPYVGTGNDLQFYIDKGGIYRFGNEYNKGASNFEIDPNGTLIPGPFEVLEEGPLRVWLRTTTYFKSNGDNITGTYIRDYILVAGEPFLRMSFTGAAPLTADGKPTTDDPESGNPYSVMVRFPFAQPGGKDLIPVDNLTFGTPYHWVTQMPIAYWPPPTFQAMHDYLLPQASGSVLAAIYQSTIPAWAVDGTGAMIGCVVRNSPAGVGNYGQNGQDTGTHTHHYAIRVPSGIEDPTTGAQLQESRILTTPLRAAYVTVPVTDSKAVATFPKFFSLASVTPSSAIITAAKPGTLDPSSLIIRLYQPTNQALAVSVTLAPQITSATAELVTALEDPIAGSPSIPINQSTISLTVPLALATLRVNPPPPPLN